MKTILFAFVLFLSTQSPEWKLYYSGDNSDIFSLTENYDGSIWFGNRDGQLGKVDSTSNPIYQLPTDYPLYSIDCDQDSNIWIATQDTGLVKFNGVNWIYFNMREIVTRTPQFNNANCVRVDDNNNVWIGCAGGLAKYDGVNWIAYDDLNSPLLVWPDILSIKFDGQNNLWFSNYYGAGRFNAGNWYFWNTLPAPPFQYLLTVAIGTDGTVWFGDTWGYQVLKIINDTTWLPYDNIKTSAHSAYQFDIDNRNIKWFSIWPLGNTGPRILAFNDTTFTDLVVPFDEVENSVVHSVYVDKLNNKWFGFSNGYIVKYTGDFPSGIDEENDIIVSDFKLDQNYPNPFNPSTTISYQIPQQEFVTIKVYDILGNEIVVLVNEEKPVGTFEIEFKASALPSGVYFYQLKAGEYIETKKMILLK